MTLETAILIQCFENAPASYRAMSAPSGPKSQKSQKQVKREFPGPLQPRGPKSPKRAQDESKDGSFRTFSTLGPEGSGRFFLTFGGFLRTVCNRAGPI